MLHILPVYQTSCISSRWTPDRRVSSSGVDINREVIIIKADAMQSNAYPPPHPLPFSQTSSPPREESIPSPTSCLLPTAINIKLLRPLRFDVIPKLTLGERHLGLLLVERIELGVQCLGESFDLAAGMELVPGVAAGVPLAGFQDHHEGVEAVHYLRELTVGDLVIFVFVWVCCEVDRLVRVILGGSYQYGVWWMEGCWSHLEIVELHLVRAPDSVVNTVLIRHDSHTLVRVLLVAVVGILLPVTGVAVDTLWNGQTPVLDGDVLFLVV